MDEETMQIRINLKVIDDQLFMEVDGKFCEIEGRMRKVVILKIVERWEEIMLLVRESLVVVAENYSIH